MRQILMPSKADSPEKAALKRECIELEKKLAYAESERRRLMLCTWELHKCTEKDREVKDLQAALHRKLGELQRMR